jgi:hypothetical protein
MLVTSGGTSELNAEHPCFFNLVQNTNDNYQNYQYTLGAVGPLNIFSRKIYF